MSDQKLGSIFFIHPRTAEEAVAEFNTDLARHIDRLETRAKHTRNASENNKIAYALAEFRQLLDFWQRVNTVRPKRRRNGEQKT